MRYSWGFVAVVGILGLLFWPWLLLFAGAGLIILAVALVLKALAK